MNACDSPGRQDTKYLAKASIVPPGCQIPLGDYPSELPGAHGSDVMKSTR